MVTGVVPHVGGPILKGAATVLIGKLPAARSLDQATCVGPPDILGIGSPLVLIEKFPAARMGDMTFHGGVIALGLPTVLIGENPGVPFFGVISPGGIGSITSIATGMGSASPQGQALRQAAQTGKSFCEI
jgi:uncharacterized Zn-binding protein involved in type VI secretion